MPLSQDAGATRKVLVVAYYFPPMGLSGVQRISRFVKYLPEFGWQPTVLTVQPGGYFAFDPSLEQELNDLSIEIVRTSSIDPTRLFGRSSVVKVPREGIRSRASAASQYVFLPDNKIGWYPAAVRAGTKLLRTARYDAILSTAPPYTTHLIAAALKRRAGIPLVCDFRDDWLGNPRHVYPTRFHCRIQRRLEARAIRASDLVLTINEPILESLRSRHPELNAEGRARVLPQGFDPADFEREAREVEMPGVEPRSPATERPFTLLYTGIFYDAQRPDTLFEAVAHLRSSQPTVAARLRLEFVGVLSDEARGLARSLSIDDLITYHGYLPHDQVINHIKSADALWMVIGKRPGAEGISTGKLFEYFGSRKPILALVPEGTARSKLEQYGAALIVDPDDPLKTASAIKALVDARDAGRVLGPSEEFIGQFDRRRLTGELAHLLDKLNNTHARSR